MEIWKNIKDYEGEYLISNYGNVRSIKSDKILSPLVHTTQCYFVTLCKNGVQKNHRIHRLVAEQYIPNPLYKKTVNHLDGNRFNNFVSNLEWATQAENIQHAYDNGLNGHKKGVIQKTLDNKFIKRYSSAREAGKEGFRHQLIGKCCLGKRNSHLGYRWEFALD